MQPSSQSNTGMIAGIIAITLLIFGGLTWAILKAPAEPSGPVAGQEEKLVFNDANDPTIGPANATVVVHMAGDFQCPACRQAELAVKPTIEKYKDRVQFVWKDFPLPFHKNSRLAANVARCAQVQGKFWDMHDKLFAEQLNWSEESNPEPKFIQYAKDLGLNDVALQACVDARSQDQRIADDAAEGNQNRIDRTPTFFINNRRYFTMSPVEWSEKLDAALSAASTTNQVP